MPDLIATVFDEHPAAGYRGRTLLNAAADVTLAFAADFSTAGERLTKRSVLEQGRIYCPVAYRGHLATERAIHAAVAALNRPAKPEVALNIAGNGLYTLKALGSQADVDAYAADFLRRVLSSADLRASIALVRSGGQTGFDEAGVKAARQLGLRTQVLAPKGWTFRTADGQDISDERAFKKRFHQDLSLAYTYDELRQRYRALLKHNPGTALAVSGGNLVIADPDSNNVYLAPHLDGPEVVDVRDVFPFGHTERRRSCFLEDGSWEGISPEDVIREIEEPRLVYLPKGFDQALRDIFARCGGHVDIDHDIHEP